jgi:hypothetical protein
MDANAKGIVVIDRREHPYPTVFDGLNANAVGVPHHIPAPFSKSWHHAAALLSASGQNGIYRKTDTTKKRKTPEKTGGSGMCWGHASLASVRASAFVAQARFARAQLRALVKFTSFPN